MIILLTNCLALSLVVATLGDELDATAAHDAGSEHVAVELLLRRELQHVEGVLGVLQLLVVVDGLDLDLALRDVDVVEGISRDGAPEKKSCYFQSNVFCYNYFALRPPSQIPSP